MTPQPVVEASAPGKLYIAGEYAVVHPGHAALLIAVDRYIHVTLTPTGTTHGEIRTHTTDPTQPNHPPLHWNATTNPHTAAHFHTNDHGFHKYVAAAITTVERWRAEKNLPPSAYTIDTTSTLNDTTSGTKFGLGSSAAITTATIAAAAHHHGLHPTPEQIYRLATIATTRITTKTSGGDIAASALGGWVHYHSPDRTWLHHHAWTPHTTTTINHLLTTPWPGLTLHRITPADPGIQLAVGWTGTPADTTTLVGNIVKKTALPDTLLHRSDAAVDALTTALTTHNTTAIATAIATARHILGHIAQQRGVTIETPALHTLATIALTTGWWAKSSGAGGGDCGIALTTPDTNPHALHHHWATAGIQPLDLHVSPHGAHATTTPNHHTPMEGDGE
ncbi:phosphomevalonate kinase [Corynebacterium kroppenstedtii]|uniref:phosphomevalonate kinase n=1 Tax=Corynebacterium sp. PCR 32 TaxID=3351342 RepID=UPI0030B579D4